MLTSGAGVRQRRSQSKSRSDYLPNKFDRLKVALEDSWPPELKNCREFVQNDGLRS